MFLFKTAKIRYFFQIHVCLFVFLPSLKYDVMFIFKSFRSIDPEREKRRFVETYFGQVLLVFIGASFSILLTLGAANLIQKRERRENQRLSAMMVMSHIENFARNAEKFSERMAPNDSTAAWLLSKPIEELELLPDNELINMVYHASSVQFMSHDKSVESIFSNNTETWKNLGNFDFIDQVGSCFAGMNTVEEYWNKWVTEMEESTKKIKNHPDNYEGGTLGIKYMKDESMRSLLQSIHARRGWLNYVAATMRYYNLHNMECMGITEEEVIEFANAREEGSKNNNPAPRDTEYYTPALQPDSLFTFRELELRLDSLKRL